MKKFINIISKAAMVFMAIAITASCVFEQHDTLGEAKKENVLVQIAVNTSAMTATKADIFDGGTQAPVPTIETDIKTLRLYAYIDGRLCGYLYEEDVDTENDALLMDMILPDNGMVDIDMVAIANERGMTVPEGVNLDYTLARNPDGTLSLTGNAGQNEFNSITFALPDQKFENGMPMYSTSRASINVSDARRLNEQDGHKGHFIIETPVSLTLSRPLAKVGVWAANDAKEGTDPGVTVTSVTLMNVPAAGTLMPGAGADGEDRGTVQVQAAAGPVRVTAFLDREAEDFQQDRQDPDCYTPVTGDVYMPENPQGQEPGQGYDWTDGAADGATFVRIKYRSNNNISNGTDDAAQNEKTADVYLPKIIRNTQYKLLCNIKNNNIANVIVVVEDWNEGSSTTIDFTDVPNFNEEFGLQWNGQKIEGNEYKLESAAGSSVECRFKISAPVGGKWYATLTGGDVQNYELIGGTGTDGRASGNIGGDASFTIRALNSNFEGTTSRDVKLVITAVSRDGRSMVVKFNDQGYYTITQKQS